MNSPDQTASGKGPNGVNWKVRAVSRKARSIGLDVKLVRRMFGPNHAQNRIFINSRRCQLMTTPTLGQRATDDGGAVSSAWAEFVICIGGRRGESESSFLVIPRERLDASTAAVSRELEEYADRWDLLCSHEG
jgi:hypothetical protein